MQVHKYYSTFIYSVGRASRVLLEGRTRATRASVEEEREVLCEVAFASELCEETRLDFFHMNFTSFAYCRDAYTLQNYIYERIRYKRRGWRREQKKDSDGWRRKAVRKKSGNPEF